MPGRPWLPDRVETRCCPSSREERDALATQLRHVPPILKWWKSASNPNRARSCLAMVFTIGNGSSVIDPQPSQTRWTWAASARW